MVFVSTSVKINFAYIFSFALFANISPIKEDFSIFFTFFDLTSFSIEDAETKVFFVYHL